MLVILEDILLLLAKEEDFVNKDEEFVDPSLTDDDDELFEAELNELIRPLSVRRFTMQAELWFDWRSNCLKLAKNELEWLSLLCLKTNLINKKILAVKKKFQKLY